MIDKLVVKLLTLKMWLSDDHGQDIMEYAMLSGLIALAIIAVGVAFFSGALESMFGGIGDCIDFDSTTSCAPF